MANNSRTFRIFVSSTFSDLKGERNALQRHVFLSLRDLCLRHGCRFQAIDLRWGVRDEAGLTKVGQSISGADRGGHAGLLEDQNLHLLISP